MPNHRTGGSTHKPNDTSPTAGSASTGPARLASARLALTCAALAAALSGCESLGFLSGAPSAASTSPSAFASASDETASLPPLATSFIDSRSAFVPSDASAATSASRTESGASTSSGRNKRRRARNRGDATAGADASATSARVDTGLDVLVRPEIELEALPARPGDLLQRLRASFSLTAANDAAFERELQYFASHPEYVERVVTRSMPYLYYIADQIYRRGMPAELALLPIVESAFDPFAYSRGRAAGLWQIIPGTARRLGVKQNWWFDGRRDLLDSTRAALDYLEELHGRFGGDWLLAVAGYNSGEGNVARAIRAAQQAHRPTDFWGIRPYLPKETRTYVPRLLAICSLLANPERYDLELPALPDKPGLAVVETGGQIDMALAAKLAGIEVDELYRLNAGVNRWATDPTGPHRLVLPADRADAFRASLAALGERERVEWTRYKIEQGDSLIELARRFRTTPEVLREANRLHGNTIRSGDYLMIPHAIESLDAYSQTVAARTARVQQREHADERREHVVQSGESLWSISQHYGVTVSALAKWNAMAPRDPLSVGRKLVIWTNPAPAPAAGGGTASISATDADTASTLATDAGTASTLAPDAGTTSAPAAGASAASIPVGAAASLASGTGGTAAIPTRDVAAIATGGAAAIVTDAGGLARGAPSSLDRIRKVNYVVRGGDSLYSIASRFRISVAQLLEWNDGLSTDDYLHPGEHLVMFVNVTEQST